MNPYEVILSPVISEKSTALNAKSNQVVFRVGRFADKTAIKKAVEAIYPKTTVVAVNTSHMPGKIKRVRRSLGSTSAWKKAIVTLKAGSKIEFQ